MEQHYDAFVYVANWGTHRLMLRLPKTAVVLRDWKRYHNDETVKIWSKSAHMIVDLKVNEEGGDWEDGSGWLDDLLPVRDLLLEGDLRPLYLGWLSGLQGSYFPDDDPGTALEPPVPAGLAKLTGPLRRLAEFLWLEPELLRVAARGSTPAGAG